MRDFNHSVNVLVKAYMDDTLEHENCCACAVGNLIADATNKLIVWDEGSHSHCFKWEGYDYPIQWLDYLNKKFRKSGKPRFSDSDLIGLYMLESTGYTAAELNRIEFAFEHCDYDDNNDQWMLNGLLQVVDVLADIHGIDLKEKEEAKALFVK